MDDKRKALIGFIFLVVVGLSMLFWSKQSIKTIKKTSLILDTYVSITVEAPEAQGNDAILAAFKKMRQIEKKLNRYDPQSEISEINKNASRPVKVSAETLEATKLGLKYAKLSEGRFDITVGPLVKLFDFNKRIVPRPSQVREAKKKVGYKNVVIDEKNSTVSLKKKGMTLDLGGLSKGLAADEALKVLKKHHVKAALIDTGSSTLAFDGNKKHGRVWKVGLRHPRKDEIISVFKVRNYSLSTSGDYQQYFVKSGRRYHHIIDPNTGYPAKGLVSVTVISKKTAAESDILSTAIFAMGPQKGYEFAKKLKNTETVLIDTAGRVLTANKRVSALPKRINLSKK